MKKITNYEKEMKKITKKTELERELDKVNRKIRDLEYELTQQSFTRNIIIMHLNRTDYYKNKVK